MLTITYTVVFRVKALIPIYVYVMINGLYAGFNAWWVPYLYIWTILWGITMLLPRKMKPSVAAVVYPAVCGFYGLIFGILYAPAEAVIYGMDFEQMLAWIALGTGFDILHAVGNTAMGLLVFAHSRPRRSRKTRDLYSIPGMPPWAMICQLPLVPV